MVQYTYAEQQPLWETRVYRKLLRNGWNVHFYLKSSTSQNYTQLSLKNFELIFFTRGKILQLTTVVTESTNCRLGEVVVRVLTLIEETFPSLYMLCN